DIDHRRRNKRPGLCIYALQNNLAGGDIGRLSECAREIDSGLKAVYRFPRHCPQHGIFDCPGNLRAKIAQWSRGRPSVKIPDLTINLAVERKLTRQHPVEDDAEAIDV